MDSLVIEKDFLSNVDYLQTLIKQVNSKGVSDCDSNLVYEIIYAYTYVTDLLPKVHDSNLVITINDIKVALDIIISGISEDDLKSARAKLDYTKILKAKYSDVSKGSFEEKVAYNVTESTLMKSYIMQRLPSLLLLVILVFLLMSGTITKLADLLTSIIVPTGNPQDTKVSEVFEVFKPLVTSLFSFIVLIMFTASMLYFSIDLLYINIPFFRSFLEESGIKKSIVSTCANSLIEEVDGKVIRYHKVKSFDRIKRNEYWLQSMIDSLNSLRDSGIAIDNDLLNNLVNVKSMLNDYDENSKLWYMAIAKVEFLHNKYLDFIDTLGTENSNCSLTSDLATN